MSVLADEERTKILVGGRPYTSTIRRMNGLTSGTVRRNSGLTFFTWYTRRRSRASSMSAWFAPCRRPPTCELVLRPNNHSPLPESACARFLVGAEAGPSPTSRSPTKSPHDAKSQEDPQLLRRKGRRWSGEDFDQTHGSPRAWPPAFHPLDGRPGLL